jgi:uncharacterized protein YggE
MKSTAQTAILAALLTACAGPSAGGQTTAADPGQLGRANLYEVPNSDIEALRRQAPEGGWIEVSGTGSVEVRPDRARAAFAMETRAETADAAADANAEAMTKVLDALRGAGLDGLELSTHGYALRPEYEVQNNRRTQQIVAYTVVNNVSATLSDVDAVGRAIDAGVRAGANRVAGISFFASDTDDARREALAEAVRVARAEAEVMARALGHTLGPALEVRGGAQRPNPVPYAMESMSAMRAADTPVEVGDQTVTASVTIRFALGPESGG